MRHSASPLKAAGVVSDGARGEVWRAVALQAHLLGKPPRPVRTRSASAHTQERGLRSQAAEPCRSAPSAGFRHAELDYDEKLRRHQASLSLAQRMGLVAEPAQPLTSVQWEHVKHASDSRQDSEVPCTICLEDFRTRPQVILSCSHVFHGECLRSFERFAGKRHCPLCRCPYFDATIHHSGLMVWRKKCASRIQRAWRGYTSRKELFNELRDPNIRKEAPALHRRCCGKVLQALGGKLEKACEDHEDALERFLQELDGSVAQSSALIREGLCGFEQLHSGMVAPLPAASSNQEAMSKDCAQAEEGTAQPAESTKFRNGHGQQLEKLHEVGEKKSTVQFAFNPATWQTDKVIGPPDEVIGWNCYRVRTSFIAAALCLSSPSMSLRYICAQFAARLTTDVPGIMRHKQNHLDLSLTKIFHTDSEVFPNLVHGLQG